MAELKRGDIIRNKITGETGIFYSYYRYKDNHEDMYVLLPMYETPQIVKINSYASTGEHIDIFEKIKQSEPINEKVKAAQDLMNSIQNLFWNNNSKENKNVQNIDDYDPGYDDFLSKHDDPFDDDYEALDYASEDDRVLIDVDDFIALAQSEATSKTTLNYILRALRLGVEPSVILTIFDENTGESINELFTKPESPFYIPGNDEEIEK